MKACYTAKVPEVILCTFEDVDADASSTGVVVDETNAQSQIMPQIDWSVCPSFEGMSGVKYYARTVGIRITHMITVVRGKVGVDAHYSGGILFEKVCDSHTHACFAWQIRNLLIFILMIFISFCF